MQNCNAVYLNYTSERVFFEIRLRLTKIVQQVDRTRQVYFNEESGASDVRDKAKDAEDKAKGRKKDISSLFQSTKTLRKKAGNLSVKQEELDIKSTGARNDYILGLASTNAHQEQYFKHDMQVSAQNLLKERPSNVNFVFQDIMKQLEQDCYGKFAGYFDTIARTELLTCSAVKSSFEGIAELAGNVSRGHNFRCYVKAYPSLAEHVQ